MNEVLKCSRRDGKGLPSLWISGSYLFNMWNVTEMQVREEEGRNHMSQTLPVPPRRQIFFFFPEALQIKLSSKNILIELG